MEMCRLCRVLIKDPNHYVEEKGQEVPLCERCFDVYLQILARENKLPILEGR